MIDTRFQIAAPAVPGLRFRPYAGPADVPGMVDANMAVRLANGVEEAVDIAGMSHQYANLTNCDPARDLLIIELDDRIAGYVRVDWSDQNDGSRTYNVTCLIHPDVTGRGIGSAVLAWGEGRLREIAANHDIAAPRWFEQETWDAEASAGELLTRHGYAPVRTFHEMVRPTLDDIPAAEIPDGFEVGSMEAGGLRAIWEAEIKALADHWGAFESTEEAYATFASDPHLEQELFVVAYAGDEVAGAVRNAISDEENARFERKRGTLDSVFVRRPYRRRGLGRALVLRSLTLLRERGMTSAVLGVDAENPNEALRLYESCGFAAVRSSTVWRKQLRDSTEDDR